MAITPVAKLREELACSTQMFKENIETLQQKIADPNPLQLEDLLSLLKEVAILLEHPGSEIEEIRNTFVELKTNALSLTQEEKQVLFDITLEAWMLFNENNIPLTALFHSNQHIHKHLQARSWQLIETHRENPATVMQLIPFLPPEQQTSIYNHIQPLLPQCIFGQPSPDFYCNPVDLSSYAPLIQECETQHQITEELSVLFFNKIQLEYEATKTSDSIEEALFKSKSLELDFQMQQLKQRISPVGRIRSVSQLIEEAKFRFCNNFNESEEVTQFIAAANFLLTVASTHLAFLRLLAIHQPEAVSNLAELFLNYDDPHIIVSENHRNQVASLTHRARNNIIAVHPLLFSTPSPDENLDEENSSQLILGQFMQARGYLANLITALQQEPMHNINISVILVEFNSKLLQIVSGFENEDELKDKELYSATTAVTEEITAYIQEPTQNFSLLLDYFDSFLRSIVEPWAQQELEQNIKTRAPTPFELALSKLDKLSTV